MYLSYRARRQEPVIHMVPDCNCKERQIRLVRIMKLEAILETTVLVEASENKIVQDDTSKTVYQDYSIRTVHGRADL